MPDKPNPSGIRSATVEPVAPGDTPSTTGQQLQSNEERGQLAAENSEEVTVGGEVLTEQDVQPAIAVQEDGKTRQVKQIKTR